MIFDRFNKYTKSNGVFKTGKLISKKCKECKKQVKTEGFTYGINTCKNCRNEINKNNYEKREQITYSKLYGTFKKGVLVSQKCNTCESDKKIDLFPNSGVKGGKCNRCRECTNTHYREKKAVEKN